MTSAGELRRCAIQSVSRPKYPPSKEGLVVLSDNSNLFGVNPAVEEVAKTFNFGSLWAYPTENSDLLRERLSSELGVSGDEVIVTSGSDELLDIVAKAFINPGDKFAVPTPTFSMYKFYAVINTASVVEVPLRDGFSLDSERMIREGAKVSAICQPNNPTGNLFDERAVRRVLTESEGVVLVDEAYADFCGSDMRRAVLESRTGVDVRTFSKAYGLAGLRAGYAVASEEIVDEMRRVRTPFTMNAFTEAVTVAALDQKEWVRDVVRRASREREYLSSRLSNLGFEVYPSECNFVLCRSPLDSAKLVDSLRTRGVAIRDCGMYTQLKDHVRVTVAPREYLDRFLEEVEPLMEGVTG